MAETRRLSRVGSGPLRPGRRGLALPAVLLVLLALTLLAHGSLYLSRQELRVARSSVGELRARLAAEAGARRAGAEAPPASGELTGELDGGGRYSAQVRWLGGELLLATSRGTADGWPGTRTVVRILWLPDPPTRTATFRAAVEAGGGVVVAGGSVVDASRPSMVPSGWEELCAGSGADTLFPGGLDPVAPLPGAPPGAEPPEPWARLGLGPVGAATLRRRADLRIGGEWVEGLPTCAGGSDGASALPQDDSCPGGLPLIVGDGPVRLPQSEGRGLLIVLGDLELAEGADFTGLVLVTGRLRLSGGARIRGLVRVLEDVAVVEGSTVEASACPVLAALETLPALDRPLPLATGSWLDLP